MGKGIDTQELLTRSKKLAFMQVSSGGAYVRMEGFTDLSNSNNAKTYSRQYVDEDTDRTSVNGYSPSTSYSFDRYKGNSVLEHLVKIHDDLLVGSDAVVSIVQVDMSTFVPTDENTTDGGTATGYVQNYSVQADGDGSSTDALTYSGTFAGNGTRTAVTVKFNAGGNFQYCTMSSAETLGLSTVEVYNASGTLVETLKYTANTTAKTLSGWTTGTMKLKIVSDVAGTTKYATYGDNTLFEGTDGYIAIANVSTGTVTVSARAGAVEGHVYINVTA